MSVRERGATVGMMWVIVLIVLLLAAGGWIYSRETEFQSVLNQKAAADALVAERDADLITKSEALQKISNLVGFKADPTANSSNDLIANKIADLKGRYPNDFGADDKTIADAVERLVVMFDKQVTATRDAANQFQTELTARGASDEAKSSTEQALQGQIAQLNTDLRDERDRATNQKGQDDGRITALQGQLDESNAQKRTIESDFATEKAKIQKEKDQSDGRVAELSNKIKIAGFDETAFDADGTVVSVGKATGTVFLDVGSKDLLRRGVKFDVFRHGKGGTLIPKGSIEVREVHAESSVCAVVGELNQLDPIAPGDVVANPLFSKTREKVFVLLGNFPVYGKNFLEKRITDLGAEVESTVTSRTDFVVLGEKMPEEDAVEVTDTPEFKNAQKLGVQVLRMSDIERFIKP